PATEHIRVANLLLRSAATTGTDNGALVNRNWNDHAQGTNSQGHLLHIAERLRQEVSSWHDGVALTLKNVAGAALTTGNSSTAVELVTTVGSIYQLHKQTFPAHDMYVNANDDTHIVNDSVSPYLTTADLVTDVTAIADGTAIGVNKYFNLVIWGAQNKSGEAQHLLVNLPTGQYTTSANAVSDVDGYSIFSIPNAYRGVGFLIARLTFRLIAGSQWTYIAQEDLRGLIPPISAGVGVTTTDHALLANLLVDDHTLYLLADGTRALTGAWDMGSQNLTNVNIDGGTIGGVTLDGTITLGGQVFDAGSGYLEIDTTGRHGLVIDGGIVTGGATPLGRTQHWFSGNFVSDGSSNFAWKQTCGGRLTGADGDTAELIGSLFANTIVTQTAAETIGIVAQLRLAEPTTTKNVTTITTAATLYILDAPTEGTTNAAIYVASGDTNIQTMTLGGKLTAGANEIEGSNFDINGGTIDGVTIT
ncbi:hypothetical protein LCGC14_2572110, partial [marine sediment metagenome]